MYILSLVITILPALTNENAAADVSSVCSPYLRKLDVKQRQLVRLEEQLHKLEVQATDKVSCQVSGRTLINCFFPRSKRTRR